MSSTRTSSPYFSPNSIIAPDFFASSIGMTWARVGVFCRISAFTRCSTSRICSSVIGLSWAKSKRVLLCVDQRALLLHVRAEHLAQRLVHEVGDRVVAHGARAQRRVDARLDLVADLQRAGLQRALVAVDVGLDLLRVGHLEGAAGADQLAAVADLAAGLGVERRAVEHHRAGIAALQRLRPARPRGTARPPWPAGSACRSRGTRSSRRSTPGRPPSRTSTPRAPWSRCSCIAVS